MLSTRKLYIFLSQFIGILKLLEYLVIDNLLLTDFILQNKCNFMTIYLFNPILLLPHMNIIWIYYDGWIHSSFIKH